ncbi:MAG: hypothetical protein JNL61_18040 [Rhizobiaceae bacterium]|nr:hypothetical protein [Rhizobiaceae bacterium]
MSLAVPSETRRTSALSWLATPPWVLAATIAVLLALLLLPLRLPLGGMYWDLFVYFDGAQRVLLGQMPSADFYAPVGPLGYYLFAGGVSLFSHAQPLLLVQWCMIVVTAPVMFVVLRDVGQRSQADAWALLVPYLAFSLLPFNSISVSVYPGVDGFGIYNRHESYLLYVLACALMFIRAPSRMLLVLAWLMPALFLVKITGFAVAVVLCAFAFVAGRISLRTALSAVAAFVVILGALQVATGMVSAYASDILALLGENRGTLLPRFATVASQNFGLLAPGFLLAALLFAIDVTELRRNGAAVLRKSGPFTALSWLLDRDWMWLAVLLIGGMAFETQNTGSQSFLMAWPALYLALKRAWSMPAGARVPIFLLVAFAAVPTASDLLHRSARAAAAELGNTPLQSRYLGTMGAVSAKQEFFDQAAREREYFVAYRGDPVPAPIEDTSSHRPFSEIDFQLQFLQNVDEATGMILDYENANALRFQSILTLDFINPFPWLLDRDAPRHVSIGAVPDRTARPLDDRMRAAIDATDLILVPRCTATGLSRGLFALYSEAFADHRKVSLTGCYDGYIRPGLLAN